MGGCVKKLGIAVIGVDNDEFLCTLSSPALTSIEQYFKAELAPDTPLSYLTKLRINHLRRLLDSTDLPISEAAEKSGFVDIPNLSRIFKKHTGMSPSAYRKKRNSPPYTFRKSFWR